MIYIGIDMSLTSPGLAIKNDYRQYYQFYFFAQRKSELDFEYFSPDGNVYIKSWEYPKWKNREERFEKITKIIIDTLDSETENGHSEHVVGIEGYSYGSTGRSILNLAEIGGVLRNKIYRKGYNFKEFTPSEIKKFYTKKGNANKTRMYEQFESEKLINFHKVLGIKKSKVGIIAHPIEDLIDSYAIVQYLQGIKSKFITDKVKNILKKLTLGQK